jgi:UDP-N-acetylmuramate--alanine ligase
MPHTYSRTAALLDDFARSFEDADVVFLHKIYASAREAGGLVTGEALFEKTRRLHSGARYAAEPDGAFDELTLILRPGDIFISMGAGDNWKLCHALYGHYKNIEAAR